MIITCVRWYLRFKLSYRDLAELARELGVRVAPSTILRWVVLLASLRAAGRRFLAHGRNLPQCARPIGFTFTGPSTNKAKRLSPTFTRDVTAAKAFFRKAFRRHGDPRVDYPGTASNRPMPLCVAWREQRWEAAVQIRTCPYLNNVVEQDHRRIKARVGPMLGFKRFFNARRVLAGIELVLIKGQFGLPESFATAPLHVWYNVLAT